MKLLGFQNAKTSKGEALGYLTGIMYLMPSYRVCSAASKGCMKVCLRNSGRLAMAMQRECAINKTKYFNTDPISFFHQLKIEIKIAQRRAAKKGMKLAIRLNGTSDIAFETISNVIQSFPDVQFYDYTKVISRLFGKPANLDLTFSLSETNLNDAMMALSMGYRVAAVFDVVPEEYLGFEVVDGDKHDLRFLDKTGVIVGLKAKGPAKKDTTGFVIRDVTIRKVA